MTAARPGLVIGVDIGTSSVKAVALDVAAVSHAETGQEYPTQAPLPGWSVQDPDSIAAATAAVVRDVAAKVGRTGGRVAAVAFSSPMHSLVALAEEGSPITPLVTWADGRAAEQARRLHADGQSIALHRRTGTPVHPMSPLVKLLWFREQQPEIWRRAASWVGIKEYVLLRLTGRLVVDESIASATGLYGLASRNWDAEALALVGVRRDQLPVLRQPVDVVGELDREEAAWGLPVGTPIVIGASDGGLANLGAGAVAPGVTACSIGTSAAVRGVVSTPSVDPKARVFCYFLVPGRWVVGGATNNGGNVLRWLGRVACADLVDPDTELPQLAATVPPGAEGLLMLPYLAGERAPRWAGWPRGAILGLTLRHTRAHLARAALEGVCLQLALVLQAMRDAGLELTELRATGGFANSPFWRQLLADVLGTSIGFTAGRQGTAVGSALLGHVALGHLPSVDHAAALVTVTDVARPDQEAARFYRDLLPSFAAAAQTVEEIP